MRLGKIEIGGPRQQVGSECALREPSRALVALAPVLPTREPSVRYRQAPFVAHLLAVKDQHAQTCARRRVTPAEAIAAYRATAALIES